METGELEVRKIFEETTTRNVTAILDHSNKTRALVRELNDRIDKMEESIRVFSGMIDEMRKQLSFVQAELYKGGTK